MGNLCSPPVQETDVPARYDIAYCFVNAKSGGGVGKKLLNLELRRLQWTKRYGSVVIVDLLSKEERERSVKELAKLTSQNQRVCAICAGGDGTVKWILQVFAKAKIKNVRSSFFISTCESVFKHTCNTNRYLWASFRSEPAMTCLVVLVGVEVHRGVWSTRV